MNKEDNISSNDTYIPKHAHREYLDNIKKEIDISSEIDNDNDFWDNDKKYSSIIKNYNKINEDINKEEDNNNTIDTKDNDIHTKRKRKINKSKVIWTILMFIFIIIIIFCIIKIFFWNKDNKKTSSLIDNISSDTTIKVVTIGIILSSH